MSYHTRARTSRALIALLGVTIVLGALSYLHNLSKARAEQAARAAAAKTDALSVDANDSAAGTLIADSRTGAPTADPMIKSDPEPASTRPAETMPTSAPSVQLGQPHAPSGDTGRGAVGGIADAKAKKAAGQLLAARDTLNGALAAGSLSAADADAARQMLAEINDAVVFSTQRFADDPFGGTYTVRSGENLAKIAAGYNVTWQLLCRVNGLADPRKLRAGAAIKVIKGPFHAVVSKSKFTLDIYLGSPGGPDATFVTSFPVGLGKDDSTPTGTWQVEPQNKILKPVYYSPRGDGVIEASDPKNPLGGYWIGLSGLDGHAVGKTSYGIHGTIDPSSIGRQESMGCIRLRNEDIAKLFDLLVEGKSHVVVKD